VGRRKTFLNSDDFTRKLRDWGMYGCGVAIVVYAAICRIDSENMPDSLVERVFDGVMFGLAGIIFGRLLVTYFYDKDT